MRKAGITLMVAHPFLDYFSAHAHFGHSTGGHLDDYIEMDGIGLSVAPMKALNGYNNLQQHPVPVPFSCLGDAEDFGPNDHLHFVLKIVGATLIMFCNKMKSKYGTHNPVSPGFYRFFIWNMNWE